MRVKVADLVLDLQPLMDDQELDSRASTGAIYWEGAVEASTAGRVVGQDLETVGGGSAGSAVGDQKEPSRPLTDFVGALTE